MRPSSCMRLNGVGWPRSVRDVYDAWQDSPTEWAVRVIHEHLAEHLEDDFLNLPAHEPLLFYGIGSVDLIHVLAALERRFRLDLGVLVDVADEQVSVLSLADDLARAWQNRASLNPPGPQNPDSNRHPGIPGTSSR